jgi:hypothetical protein
VLSITICVAIGILRCKVPKFYGVIQLTRKPNNETLAVN